MTHRISELIAVIHNFNVMFDLHHDLQLFTMQISFNGNNIDGIKSSIMLYDLQLIAAHAASTLVNFLKFC